MAVGWGFLSFALRRAFMSLKLGAIVTNGSGTEGETVAYSLSLF